MTDKPIDEAEARRILENLARNGPPTAQVAAIKVIREMDKDADPAERAEGKRAPSRSCIPGCTRTSGRARGEETARLTMRTETAQLPSRPKPVREAAPPGVSQLWDEDALLHKERVVVNGRGHAVLTPVLNLDLTHLPDRPKSLRDRSGHDCVG